MACKVRKEEATKIKHDMHPPEYNALHCDGKQIKDCGETKQERFIISISGEPDYIEGKFLHASKILSHDETGIKMGRSEAMAAAEVCEDWKLMEVIWAMVFDTTATNTGIHNGACTILEEEFFKRKLLWLACRHHVPELVIKAVWQRLFGKSSSPSNQTFVQFRDKFGLILIKMLIPPHSS